MELLKNSKYKPITVTRFTNSLLTRRDVLQQQNSEFFPEPTAHEVYVRDRIPRGAHYDTADDGPETDRKFQCLIAAVVKVVSDAMLWEKFEESWLGKRSSEYDFGGLDILVHGRE